LNHHYEISPGYKNSKVIIDKAFSSLGYYPNFISIDHILGNPAALGNLIRIFFALRFGDIKTIIIQLLKII
tara:strand:- start:418 stop:630 length:213 start_codon:yes stop_codon:yes gene_type:complete